MQGQLPAGNPPRPGPALAPPPGPAPPYGLAGPLLPSAGHAGPLRSRRGAGEGGDPRRIGTVSAPVSATSRLPWQQQGGGGGAAAEAFWKARNALASFRGSQIPHALPLPRSLHDRPGPGRGAADRAQGGISLSWDALRPRDRSFLQGPQRLQATSPPEGWRAPGGGHRGSPARSRKSLWTQPKAERGQAWHGGGAESFLRPLGMHPWGGGRQPPRLDGVGAGTVGGRAVWSQDPRRRAGSPISMHAAHSPGSHTAHPGPGGRPWAPLSRIAGGGQRGWEPGGPRKPPIRDGGCCPVGGSRGPQAPAPLGGSSHEVDLCKQTGESLALNEAVCQCKLIYHRLPE